ncbi:polyprotein [Plakobranchus ocellatus]|uniref:Polyprotein n=1 Tax=Plakobranchus ocellatus TaxID=259542 RepID=A0AAV4BF33_9GAST|nr:polyprotein [Plakobranchus ocellatus]
MHKVQRVQPLLVLRSAPQICDPVVTSFQHELSTSRRWKVNEAVNQAKQILKMKEVIGVTQIGRKGLESGRVKWWSKKEGKEKRDMIIDEIRLKEDSKQRQKTVQQSQQGHWTSWESAE